MGKQTFVVRLDEELARRGVELLSSGTTGYASFDELMTVALVNQLSLEQSAAALHIPHPQAVAQASLGLLGRPPAVSILPLADGASPSSESLFLLTNRLSPIKIASRVLANLSTKGAWPKINTFHEQSARAARELGFTLLADDRATQRSREQRRSTAYPIGEDEHRASARFVLAFTIGGIAERPTGPLAVLGLANLVDEDRVALTEAGWRLAAASSPLLQEAPGGPLSEEEQSLLRFQLTGAPGERDSVTEFIGMVRHAEGSQGRLDELLALRRREWTVNLRIANRAALLGRLGELGFLVTTGRGPKARVALLPAAEQFEAVCRLGTS